MTDSPKKMPSKLWYALAIALIVLGPILGIFIFINQLWGNIDDLVEISASGNSTVEISQPGTYMLAQSTPQRGASVNVMKIVVKDTTNNPKETFSIKRFSNIENGVIGEIDFNQAGRYEINISSDAKPGQALKLSLANVRDLVRSAITAIFLIIMGVVGGTILAISVFLLRSRAMRSPEEKAMLSKDDHDPDARTWAAFCHLSAFSGYFVPFANIFVPLILWLLRKNHYLLVKDQGKEAVNFQLSFTLYALICLILSLVLVGFLLLAGLFIFNIIVVIMASLEASNGRHYRYPLCIRFIK